MNVNYYNGLGKIYFKKIIEEIISIGHLTDNKNIILDFGCGAKYLEKKLNKKILNYDINPAYSELKSYNNSDFNIVIFNHVLMYMHKDQINKTLEDIKNKNSSCRIIVGIGRMTLINKIASWLSLNFSAHTDAITDPKSQLEILHQNLDLISKRSVFNMTDIYYFKFKPRT